MLSGCFHRIFGYIEHGLAVDLQRYGTVKFYRDLFADKGLYDLCLFYVLTLEDSRERRESSDLALAVHDHRGYGTLGVQPVLIGGRHHSAAVKAAVHCGREPDLFKFMSHAVDGDLGVCGLVV